MGRPRLARYRNTKKKRITLLPFLILFIAALVVASLFFFMKPKYWNNKGKLSVVINSESDIQVTTFDTTFKEVTTIKIPLNTQVEVARNLGTWRLGSVWKLGKNEKVGGKLLQETIVKNFNFPVATWADSGGEGLAKGDIRSIVGPYDTNLSLLDKFKMYTFSLGVTTAKQTEIDLRATSMLRKTKLQDGTEGYIITASPQTNLISVFSDSDIANSNVQVSISDSSEKPHLSDNVGGIIETLGAKVVSKTIEKGSDLDCVVVSTDKSLSKKVAGVFNCTQEVKSPDGNFDLVIKIGKKFAERF